MKVVGLCGPSGVGKTTLAEGLLAALKARGQRVSVVKHAHRRFDIDHPGKDSFRLREAGAFEVVVASPWRLAKVRSFEAEVALNVHQLLAELVDVDWVLVEGFKHADLPKVEVWRAEVAAARGVGPMYPHDPFVVAVATDRPDALPEPTARPVVALDDPVALAAVLMDHADRHEYHPEHHAA